MKRVYINIRYADVWKVSKNRKIIYWGKCAWTSSHGIYCSELHTFIAKYIINIKE